MLNTSLKYCQKQAAALGVTASLWLAYTHSALAADAAYEMEAKQSGLPQLNIETYSSQIFWLFVSFLVLYVVFANRILPDISDVLERRRETISSDLETAETLREEAETVQKEYEDAIAQAQKEGAELLQDLQKQVRADMDRDLNSFKESSQKQIEEAEANANKEKERIMADVQSHVPELTAQIVEKLTSLDAKQADAEKVVSLLVDNKAKAA